MWPIGGHGWNSGQMLTRASRPAAWCSPMTDWNACQMSSYEGWKAESHIASPRWSCRRTPGIGGCLELAIAPDDCWIGDAELATRENPCSLEQNWLRVWCSCGTGESFATRTRDPQNQIRIMRFTLRGSKTNVSMLELRISWDPQNVRLQWMRLYF